MEQRKFASVTDIRKRTSQVFAQADAGDDVLLLSHNRPKYVLINFRKYSDLMSELEDKQDVKTINKSRKAKSQMIPWADFKNKYL